MNTRLNIPEKRANEPMMGETEVHPNNPTKKRRILNEQSNDCREGLAFMQRTVETLQQQSVFAGMSPEKVSDLLRNYGDACFEEKDMPNAISCYQASFAFAISVRAFESCRVLLNKLGNCYRETNNIKDALMVYKESLELAQTIEEKREVLKLLISCCAQYNDEPNALYYFNALQKELSNSKLGPDAEVLEIMKNLMKFELDDEVFLK